ncbi:radical SAM protein, partial [Rossellomorea marisflavi]
MNVLIKGIEDERFERPLRLIANLFFEETKIHFGECDNADLEIHIHVTDTESIHASAEIKSDYSPKAVYEKDWLPYDTEKERFRQLKTAVSHVYLNVLQEMTGIQQKWGILTGIRPTKLIHKQNMLGLQAEEIHHKLKEEYLITDEKIDLMQNIVDRQLTVVPDLYDVRDEVSIYIGIPFCPTKCAYCTFPAYAIQGKQGRVDSFLAGLHYEIREMGRWMKEKGVKITTIYFGGGTPTSITAEEMDALYEEMYDSFPDVDKVREVTVEAGRPDTITPDKLKVLNKWNIDRISINPQSYTQETLKAIGRHHTV